MLTLTTTIEKLIDKALLYLWYAEHWKNLREMPEEVVKDNVKGFISQADGIIQFIYTEIMSGNQLVDYKDTKVPENHLPYYQEREKYYQHPQ